MFTLCIEKANMHHIKALKAISKQPFNVSLSPSVMWLLSQQDDNQNEMLPTSKTEETKDPLFPSEPSIINSHDRDDCHR